MEFKTFPFGVCILSQHDFSRYEKQDIMFTYSAGTLDDMNICGYSTLGVDPKKQRIEWKYFYPNNNLDDYIVPKLGAVAHVATLELIADFYRDMSGWVVHDPLSSFSRMKQLRRMGLDAAETKNFLRLFFLGVDQDFNEYLRLSKGYLEKISK
jgi:hypothetical protein